MQKSAKSILLLPLPLAPQNFKNSNLGMNNFAANFVERDRKKNYGSFFGPLASCFVLGALLLLEIDTADEKKSNDCC